MRASPTPVRGAARLLAATLALLLASLCAATAEKRVALVVGNGAYLHAQDLPNPRSDALAMSAVLRGLGFEVIEGVDLDKAGMEARVRRFAEDAADAKVALFFYAGHGMQVAGRNHLVPVDAKLDGPTAIDFETVDVDRVLGYMRGEDRVAIALLDACRDNPLARRFTRSLGGATRSGAAGQGLAAPSVAGGGILIGFATSPGDVAQDGQGANSPFTAALVKHLATPGLELQSLMTRVKADVYEATKRQQEPWHNSSLRAEFFLGGPAAPGPAVAALAEERPVSRPQPAPLAVQPAPPARWAGDEDWSREKALWDAVQAQGSAEGYQGYLNRYPNGIFVPVAEAAVAKLRVIAARPVSPAALAPAPAPSREARLQPTTAGYSHPIRLDPRGDNWIALRSLPSGTEGMRILKLGPDALFTVTGRQGTWLNVRLRSGETGWLHAAYVGCCRPAKPY